VAIRHGRAVAVENAARVDRHAVIVRAAIEVVTEALEAIAAAETTGAAETGPDSMDRRKSILRN